MPTYSISFFYNMTGFTANPVTYTLRPSVAALDWYFIFYTFYDVFLCSYDGTYCKAWLVIR